VDGVQHGRGTTVALDIFADRDNFIPTRVAHWEVLPVLCSWACVWPCCIHNSLVLGDVEIASRRSVDYTWPGMCYKIHRTGGWWICGMVLDPFHAVPNA
jgi:hypothetical protein